MVPRRRALLAALGSGIAGLAGCSALSQREPESTDTPSPSPTPTETATPEAVSNAAVDDPWGAFQSDAAHTGYAPDLAGPAEHPVVNWRTDTWGLRTSPVAADGSVYVVTGLRHDHVHALDAETGEERWRRSVDGREEHLLVAADGTVYAGLDRLYALDAETGEARWDDPREVREGIAVAEGRVVAPSDAMARIRAFDAATGDELWDQRIPGHTTSATAAPAVHDGSVYVRTHDEVFALDLETGERDWKRSVGDRAGAAPTATDDRLYVPTERRLRALDPSNREEVWRLEGRFRRSSPAVDGETLYVAGRVPEDGEHVPAVLALDAATGEERWRVEPPGFAPGSPVVTDDVVYVAADGTRLYALDADSGEVRWSLGFEWDLGTPALTEDALLVSAGGRLYSVGRGADENARPWAGVVESSDGGGESSPAYAESDFYFGTHGYDVTASSEVSTDPDAPFEFTVDVTGDRIDADDGVTMEFALTNESDEPITVDGGAPAPFEVIRLEETGPGGRALTAWSDAYEESRHVHTVPHRGVTLVNDIGLTTAIDPGETVRESYTLSTGTHRIQPGTYSLTESYTVHRGDSRRTGDEEGLWHPGVYVRVELEQPAPETGDVVHDVVLTEEASVPAEFVGDLSVDVLEPVTETHPGLVEITLRNREGSESVTGPGRWPFASYVGLEPSGSRLVLIGEDSFAPAYVADRGNDGSWVPTFLPHVERVRGVRNSRFESDAEWTKRYLVLGDPAADDPLAPGEYVFDQGYADDDVAFRWGFRLSLRDPSGDQ